MGRAKLSMSLISSEKARYTTFQKRKKGLKKKTYELKTLCGVQVCLIIYGPKIEDRQPEPEIWPQDREEIQELIDVYRKQPVEERKRRTSGVADFYEDRNRKVEEAIGKLRAKNNEVKYPTWDDRYNQLSVEDLMNILATLETKTQEVRAMVDMINGNPRLVDRVNMGSNPRLLEAPAMADPVYMGSNPNESYLVQQPAAGLFNRRNMELEVVHDQKMHHHHEYYFDQQNHQTVLQLDGSNNYVYNLPFDGQIYYDPTLMAGMVDYNVMVANSVPRPLLNSVPQPQVGGYSCSNVQPFAAPGYMQQYPVMASACWDDQYYQVSHEHDDDIKNQN